MVVCSTSALRRGIVHKAEEKQKADGEQPIAKLRLRGLGLLMDAIFESDRTITFGE